MAEKKTNSLHLIETFSGKTIARADLPAQSRQVISQSEADRYTVHDEQKGWFAPATIIFNQGKSYE